MAVGEFCKMRRHHLAVSPSSWARGTCRKGEEGGVNDKGMTREVKKEDFEKQTRLVQMVNDDTSTSNFHCKRQVRDHKSLNLSLYTLHLNEP